MAKVRVRLHGRDGYANLDTEATKGATLGENLFRQDGSIVTEADLTPTAEPSSSLAVTLWRLVREIPANIKGLAAVATDGWFRKDGATIVAREIEGADLPDLPDSGTGSLLAITRDAKGRVSGTKAATITGTAGRVTVANGDAAAGLPTVDLATVADAGGGTLLRIVRDAWGRITGTSAPTTSDLAEGTNLYHTAQRVRDTVLTGLSTATNAVIAATDTVLSALGKLQAQISGLIVQTITDGDTTHAPSGDAVFDALALKTTNSAAAITGGTINGASVGATTPASGAFTALSSTQNASIAGMPVGLGPGLDASNIAIGVGALSSRTTATVQVAIGSNALRDNQTQDANLAVGSGALALLTSGTANVAIGSGAGRDGTSHAASVLIGGNAGIFSNTVNAVAIGDNSLRYGGGTQPVAIGSGALANLSSGQGNVGIGFQALTAQTGGTGNVCVGFRAGYTATAANAITTGSHNTYVGHDSGPGTSTQLSYSSAFGAQALATTSNTVVLGRTADTTVIGATGTDGSDAKLQVTGAIKATTTIRPGSYTVATVPSASAAGAGAMIYVSNEAGGAVPAFSDGTNWRRVTDRAIIS